MVQGKDGKMVAGPYEFISYTEVNDRATYIGSAMINIFNMKPSTDEAFSMCGIYSKNRMEEQACNMHSIITVALYDTFGKENLEYVVNHAELPIVFGSIDCIENLLHVITECPKLKFLVSYEELESIGEEKFDLLKTLAKKHKIKLYSLSEVMKEDTCKSTHWMEQSQLNLGHWLISNNCDLEILSLGDPYL